jgi:dTDP-4-dehydrorhamnose 3,5-epimerase-like enzyme
MATSLFHFITLPTISDNSLLSVAQAPEIPFEIKRLYYIYDAKPGLPRGFHAHRKTDQILFCVRGKVRMVLDDGQTREEQVLSQPNQGVRLDHMIWHEMHDLDKDSLLLVLASAEYKAADYIRDYQEFLRLAGGTK